MQEKKEWAVEKPKLDNARKLRSIYFIGPEDEEYKETTKNAQKETRNSCGNGHALQDDDNKAFQGASGNCS